MRILILALTLVLSTSVNSQNFKYGKVSDEEVMEKAHPIDPNANAAVLYKKENIYFIFGTNDITQIREVHERIKIYNKEGFDLATHKVVLYRGGGSSNERINKINGVTYNFEGGKMTKDKLSKQGVFEEDVNDYIRVNSITMPNVKEGSVVEFSYTIESPFLAIDDIIFQYEVPINKLETRISTPEYYKYSKTINPRSQYTVRLLESKENKYASTSYYDDVITINEDNIPALKNEEFISSLNIYRSKLAMELSAIISANGAVENISTTWDKVCKTIYDSPRFGDQLERSTFFKDDLQSVMINNEDPVNRANAILNFVRSKVKWNGRYGYSTSNGVRNAYKDGSGNVADINLLLISMLQESGLSAFPVLVSTRDNGIPLFPTRNGFNYVICMLETDMGNIFMDATENFSSINVLPVRALNWQGRIVRKDGSSEWIGLLPQKPSIEITALSVNFNDDLSADGNIRKRLTDHLALRYRSRYSQVKNEEHVKSLEKDKGDIEIFELNFQNAKDLNKPVELYYKFELQDAVESIGDRLYVTPMLFTAMKESPFKSETRLYPIDFTYPTSDKYIINIKLPNGYKVETLPISESLGFKDQACVFTYVARDNGDFLQLNISLDINSTIIGSSDYLDFKDFFQRIIEKQSERVVLTKA